jgi:hypothetical protein
MYRVVCYNRHALLCKLVSVLNKVHHYLITGHTPRQIGITAKRLNVYKVAPSADRLANQKAHHSKVHHGKELYLAPFAHKIANHNRANQAAVNAKAAVPNLIDFIQMVLVVAPFKHHIVDSCAKDTAHKATHDHINKAVGVDAAFSGLFQRIGNGKCNPQRNQDTIPIHVDIAD